jgi:hypothetical protein
LLVVDYVDSNGYSIKITDDKQPTVIIDGFESTPEPSCEDSDGGKEYYVKGTVTKGSELFTDECGDIINEAGNQLLEEFYCLDNGEVGSNGMVCPWGCQDGACIVSNLTSCTDTDNSPHYDLGSGGLPSDINPENYPDLFIKGKTTATKGNALDFCNHGGRTSECIGPDCYLNEHFCFSDELVGQKSDIVCPNGCEDGACINVVPVPPTPTPETNPVAHYKLDGNVEDVYDRDGAEVGTVNYVEGVYGNAASLDGVGRLTLPNNDPVWLPTGDFTLSLWVYLNDDIPSNFEYILDMNHGDSSTSSNELGYCLIRDKQGYVRFAMTTSNTDEDLQGTVKLDSDQWYNLVAVRRGTSQELYVNGVLDNSRTCESTPIDFVGNYDNNQINIGGFTRATNIGPILFLNGAVDDVRIYDVALSTDEISELALVPVEE